MDTSTRRGRSALAGTGLAAALFGLEISSIPTALPQIASDLNTAFASLQWVAAAYTVGVAAVLMAAGVLGDRFGQRRVLSCSLIGFGVTSLLCALAPNAELLVAARFAQGVSGGALLTTQLAALSTAFPSGRARTHAFGIWGTTFGFGLGFGPLIGAALLELFSWRAVFWLPAALIPACLVLVLRGLPTDERTRTGAVDWPGVATLSSGLLALVGAVGFTGHHGFSNSVALALFCVAGVLLVAFIAVQQRPTAQMLPAEVLRRPALIGALAGSVGMNLSFWPLVVYLPLFLEHAGGLGVLEAGLVMLGLTLPTLLLPPLAELLTERWGAARTIPLGLSTLGAGLVLMLTGTAAAGASWLALLPGMLVAGCGLALANTPVTNTATASVPPHQAGIASGIDMTARMTTLAVSIAVLGSLLTTVITRALHSQGAPLATATATAPLVLTGEVAATQSFTDALQVLLLLAAVLVTASALLSWWCFTRADRQQVDAQPVEAHRDGGCPPSAGD